jgi:hypothetical protein
MVKFNDFFKEHFYWVFRTVEMITCGFIIAGIIHHW